MSSDLTDDLRAGIVVGIAAGLTAWWALGSLAGRSPSPARVVQLVLAVVGLVVLAYVAGLAAVFIPAVVLVPLAALGILTLTWLWSSIEGDRVRGWRATAVAASFFAIAVVPVAALVILSRGHGPLTC